MSMMNNLKDKTNLKKYEKSKNQLLSIYAKLTHDFNFTYFYSSIVYVIILTA